MPNIEFRHWNEIILGEIEGLKSSHQIRNACGCWRSTHKPQHGPDRIVTHVQPFESNVAEITVAGIRKNTISVGVLNWVDAVDGQVFTIGRREVGSVTSAPEKVAESIRSCILKNRNYFLGADKALPGRARNLADSGRNIQGIRTHQIAVGAIGGVLR